MSDTMSFLTPGRAIKGARGGQIGKEIQVTDRIAGLVDRRFTVVRDGHEGLLSTLDDDSTLTTRYSYAEQQASFPASLPMRKRWRGGTSASLEDCATGVRIFLGDLRSDVAAIRGAVGYVERRELVSDMVEYEQTYRGEFDVETEDEGSSDMD